MVREGGGAAVDRLFVSLVVSVPSFCFVVFVIPLVFFVLLPIPICISSGGVLASRAQL